MREREREGYLCCVILRKSRKRTLDINDIDINIDMGSILIFEIL